MFDWEQFLTAHRVEYVTHGSSVTKGNIACQCPYCGSADQGHHLAISTEGRGYRCFRVKSHSGRSTARLIQALLRCSWEQALRLAGVQSYVPTVDDRELGRYVAGLMQNDAAPPADDTRLAFPAEFRPLADTGAGRRFVAYLVERRKYQHNQALELAADYELQYAITGPFAGRIIFPIYMDGHLVNWTGRAIGKTRLRYKTLSTDPDKAAEEGLPAAVRSVERTLFNYDNCLEGGRELLICEGPFDAGRMDYFGVEHGVRATAVFTKSISNDQIALLGKLRPRFERMSLLLDPDAGMDILRILTTIPHLQCGTRKVPDVYEDPADLPVREVAKLIYAWLPDATTLPRASTRQSGLLTH